MLHRIVDSLLQLVEAERSGEAVNRHLLKHSVDMLANLHLYEDGVQDSLLRSATQYYSREGSALINVSHLLVVDDPVYHHPAPVCSSCCMRHSSKNAAGA